MWADNYWIPLFLLCLFPQTLNWTHIWKCVYFSVFVVLFEPALLFSFPSGAEILILKGRAHKSLLLLFGCWSFLKFMLKLTCHFNSHRSSDLWERLTALMSELMLPSWMNWCHGKVGEFHCSQQRSMDIPSPFCFMPWWHSKKAPTQSLPFDPECFTFWNCGKITLCGFCHCSTNGLRQILTLISHSVFS